MNDWINIDDTTVDESWQSLYDMLGLNLTANPNELRYYENLK